MQQGRSTPAMQRALMILGYNEVYHGFSVMANTRDADMWLEGILAKYDPAPSQKPFGRDEFDNLLGHCEAVCDMPANIFGEELIEAYPDAKLAQQRSAKRELAFRVAELHAKYGPIVRIGPDELAFSDPQAWRDIYGHRARASGSVSEGEFAKYDGFYRPVHGTPSSIFSARRDEHVMLRRQLAPGFSDRYMKAQEPIIGAYVDLLVRRLRDNCAGGKPLNMREWFSFLTTSPQIWMELTFRNWATFDIIGDLGFGSSFGCLEDSGYHPWVRNITDNFRHLGYLQVMNALGLQPIIQLIVKSGIMKKRSAHNQFVTTKVSQRMKLGAERYDLIEGLIKKKDELFSGSEEDRLSLLRMNASVLILAGSETTATLLSGAVYLLTMNPDKLAKLTREVRDNFASDDEITLLSVNDLPYMLACLNESLRLYPPVAVGTARQVPRGGASVLGKFIPENTVVAVWHWAISRDPNFWTEPHMFQPERFMGDPKFKNDHIDAMQPFSYGPRDCVGRNLAYAEMRLILSKIIWHFDMVIDDGSRRWLPDQKVYILWDKPDLNIYLTPIRR
ncbi:hypothetical protein DL771_009987 [Monosporascus sp. 5C6A]|nr:hypothetical protein DL771_009987 [Monosporascus sp. 5C6A]